MQNAQSAWQDARLQNSHAGSPVFAPVLAQQLTEPAQQDSGPAQQFTGPAQQDSGPTQQVARCAELISSSSIGPQGLLSSSWAPKQVACSALSSFRAPEQVPRSAHRAVAGSQTCFERCAEQFLGESCTEIAVTTTQ